jgi:Rnl2 family RNA ligase
MIKFKKYRSIENSYRKKFANKIVQEGFANKDITWVGTEKIDGANFGIWTDGKEVKSSSRLSILESPSEFYNADKILERYRENVLSIYKEIPTHLKTYTMCIFGELFGGIYPHPDVAKVPNASKIQGRIHYIPGNDMSVFDIILINDHNEYYLPWDLVKSISESNGMKTVPELITGTFAEVMCYPNDEQSEVYNLYGLPRIEDNAMEGVVLKPKTTYYLKDGSRVIVKNKNEKWSERSGKVKFINNDEEISETIRTVVEKISEYITENRLRNVISHFGEITNKDFGKVNKEFVNDVMSDYAKENENNNIDSLEKKERNIVYKNINRQTTSLIRKNFLNIIDKEEF